VVEPGRPSEADRTHRARHRPSGGPRRDPRVRGRTPHGTRRRPSHHGRAELDGSLCIGEGVSSPTVASSTKKGFSLDGTTLTGWTSTGSTITTDLPTGWKIGNFNGGSNSGQILNATGDSIDYHSGYERSAADNCVNLILSIKSDEDIVNLPGRTWAGKDATAVKLNVHSDERNMMVVLTYVCVDTTAGHSDLLRILASPQTNDAVMDAATSVLNAWKWN